MTSVADIVLGIINSMVLSLSGILPLEYTGLPIADFNTSFLGVAQNLSIAYNSIDFLAPAWLIISILSTIIIAEIVLVFFKATIFVANIIRGAGA